MYPQFSIIGIKLVPLS